jgi:hypothetical protein
MRSRVGLDRVDQALRELLRILARIAAGTRIDGEVERAGRIERRGNAERQVALDGDRLEIPGGLVEDEMSVLGDRGTTAIEVLNGQYRNASPGPCCTTRPP